LFLGTIDRAQGVTMRQIHEVVVRAEGNLHVHVDGEPFLARAPVVAKVHPAGLRVRVPLSRVASGFSRK
jgi:diacylglycerol kinase family enzyme